MNLNSEDSHIKIEKLLVKEKSTAKDDLAAAIAHHLEYSVGKYLGNVEKVDLFRALSLSLRDILIDKYNSSQAVFKEKRSKRVYYLSMEFLIGQLLDATMINLGIKKQIQEIMQSFGYDLDDIINVEDDAGLGNGGLGRLAACFLDSMASLNLSCYGYGLCYEFGLFRQSIYHGYQAESPDRWLVRGYPWLFKRIDKRYKVQFYGRTDAKIEGGVKKVDWHDGEQVVAEARDIFVPGYHNNVVNHLRLWVAQPSADFNLDYFNHGDYNKAVEDKIRTESISKVLYPNDSNLMGYELRLKQEYFFVSATLRDAIEIFLEEENDFQELPNRVFFQLNDTHPAIAVAELMRLLIDRYDLKWELAWSITTKCIGYTNHTIMPEALERWNLDLFGRLLPRHLEIIYDLNFQFIELLRSLGCSEEDIKQASIIEESSPKNIRMANLAVMGCSTINGVSALHSELVKQRLFPVNYRLWPNKFQNKTNGITFRRWMLSANPDLTSLINESIGEGWILNQTKLVELKKFSNDSGFLDRWRVIKLNNKKTLAKIIQERCDLKVDPTSMFDVQVKRIHEYKRQTLNVLRVIHDYLRLRENPGLVYTPRTVIFSGKAAPGYFRAKKIIKLIHCIADIVNNDPKTNQVLQVVFLPNFSVSLAERIYPASDLSEQISTAGTEASGTGNMKFMLNGALTVGTYDGANIEIAEEAGIENCYIFGKRVEDIDALHKKGYNPVQIYQQNHAVEKVLNTIKNDFFNKNEPGIFQEIFSALTYEGDHYFNLADFDAYLEIQEKINLDYQDSRIWLQKSIMNTASSAKFSSDRTILEYAKSIWKIV